MKKIKYTEFTVSHYTKPTAMVEIFVIYGHFKKGNNLNCKTIGTFHDRQTANLIKRLLTATLIKKGK